MIDDHDIGDERADAELAALRAQKDAAYAERNRCVALMARMALALGLRSGVAQHPADDKDWDPDWRTIVYIDLPAGQVSWHFHDGELHLLRDLPPYVACNAWDGHTTAEKYRRCDQPVGPTPVVAALERIQWGACDGCGNDRVCPACKGRRPPEGLEPQPGDGHRRGCPVASALGLSTVAPSEAPF